MNLSGSIPLMKNRRKSRVYKGLWSQRLNPVCVESNLDSNAEYIIQSIDELCIKADLCTGLEEYINTLCLGMEHLLSNVHNLKYVKSHLSLEDKVRRIGVDIMDQGHFESDLYYIGVFADLKLSGNWLDKKVFKVIRNLTTYVLKQGGKITDKLKEKIITKLKVLYPKKYLDYFHSEYTHNLELRSRIPI
jgi:hypothetical protein